MSKVTIASAVLAGLAIADRLNELQVADEQLHKEVGVLAAGLGALMATTEKVGAALSVVEQAIEARDDSTAIEGVKLCKIAVDELTSDQDKVMDAMLKGASEEEKLLIKLLSELSGLGLK